MSLYHDHISILHTLAFLLSFVVVLLRFILSWAHFCSDLHIFWFLLLLRCFASCGSWSLVQMVDCDSFPPALWRLLLPSQCFFHQLILSLLDSFSICCSVHQRFLSFSTPYKSLHCICLMFVQCFCTCFASTDSSMVFLLIYSFLTRNQFLQVKPKDCLTDCITVY